MGKKKTIDIPGLGKVPSSTVKKWAPTIGGLVLGRMLTRSSSGGSSRKRAAPSRRRATSDSPAQGDADAARSAPPQGNPYLKWIVLLFFVVLAVWWLADGGAQFCADALRHQRFFLRDDRGRSLFFAHNVDEAPRVPDLAEGDEISFRGEWRDNEMGGAMHWTHRAGAGRRKGGWLERDGVRYE